VSLISSCFRAFDWKNYSPCPQPLHFSLPIKLPVPPRRVCIAEGQLTAVLSARLLLLLYAQLSAAVRSDGQGKGTRIDLQCWYIERFVSVASFGGIGQMREIVMIILWKMAMTPLSDKGCLNRNGITFHLWWGKYPYSNKW